MALSRTIRVLSIGVLTAAATLVLPDTAQAAGTWHTAVAVPGLASLSAGNPSNLASISCASPGNCSAGGGYTDSHNNQQAFVVDQVNGTWHNAREMPGTATLNDAFAGTSSISCFSAGNCSAGGGYADVSFTHFPFVADRVSGTWHAAKEVPGIGALNTGGSAGTVSVSCRTGANCSAAGGYQDSQSFQQVFVVNRVNGTWGQAREMPGLGALNAGGDAGVEQVSCGTAGNCSAAGAYTDAGGHQQVFVANRVDGTWKPAAEIPGTATLNAGGHAEPGGVSCGAALNCGAVGSYHDSAGVQRAFVANRINGAWHPAFQAPGTAALSGNHNTRLISVSCPSAGNCSAGGDYVDPSGHVQAFVIGEVNGHWGNALQVPGSAALNAGNDAQVKAVSCVSAGTCTAGGFYEDAAGHLQAFVVDEVNGVWGSAQEVPGTGTLNTGGGAMVTSVSCRSASSCSAGGTYVDGSFHLEAFVVTKS
jgi:hypothetical protein